jgi:hypothetical protein
MMDDWPDDPEIGTWRQVYRNLQRTGSPACPSDDRLIALLLHDSDHAERELLTDHIVRCQRCTDTYQTLLRVQSDRSTTLQDAASGAAAILGVGMPW